jgi:hypothetical protein
MSKYDITIKSWVPFQGFYGTIYEANEECEIEHLYSEFKSFGLTKDEIVHVVENIYKSDIYYKNIKEYKDAIVLEHCKQVIKMIKEENDIDIDLKIENPELHSPTQYNYVNDSINADITVNMIKLYCEIKENIDDWSTHCKEQYTSRPGFCSHYTPEEIAYATPEEIEESDHIIGQFLNFCIGGEVNDDISMAVIENVSLSIDWEGIINDLRDKEVLKSEVTK